MDAEEALARVEDWVVAQTGERLSELQRIILQQVWQGRKYADIADIYRCTEGHAKDIGSELWKLLSQVIGEKITKKNLRLVVIDHINSGPEAAVSPTLIEDLAPDFVGRRQAMADLKQSAQQGATAIAIQGEGGLGKTTLAQQYLQSQGYEIVLEILMAKETANITSVEGVVEEWLTYDLQEDPGLEFGISLDRLKRHLHRRRIGILVDNLEPALDQQGLLIAGHRRYLELLRVLTDSRNKGLTLVTSRDRICEASLTLQHYRLPGLDLAAWQQYFSYQGISTKTQIVEQMHRAYGGNAKAMTILCGSIRSDFANDLAAFWHDQQHDLLLAADLNNLVSNQINRLQILDPQAYQLFCRLGCFRYQTVATVPTEGVLALLWDIAPAKRRSSIVSLQNRSLIEGHKGQYWLHPVIQEAAIARLRQGQDWQLANQSAAQYWTESVQTIASTQDALQALEAYYHYGAIQDYPQAAAVLLYARDNQWHQYLSLGSTLYRMGLHQSLLSELPELIAHLPCDRKFCELHNLLGDFYWTTGNIRGAIDYQQQSLHLATEAINSTVPPLPDPRTLHHLHIQELDSRLSLGLYHLDLWELETSAQFFQQVIALATDTVHHSWVPKASICLALVTAQLGHLPHAHTLVINAADLLALDETKLSGRLAYFKQLLGQTYTHLGDLPQATMLFEQALTVAEASHYPQIQARTLIGQAVIHCRQGNISAALTHHHQAITLLSHINAKCDLAEAYFQLGLTYQTTHNLIERDHYFHQAIQLFTVMNAPCQVQRVHSQTQPR